MNSETPPSELAGRYHRALVEQRAIAEQWRRDTARLAPSAMPPAPRHPFVDVALEALAHRAAAIEPESADDPLCTVRLLERPHWFTRKVATTLRTDRAGGAGHPPSLSDLGCLMLAGGLLEIEDLERASEQVTQSTAEHFGRAIVHRHLADGDLEAAQRVASSARFERVPYVGWRAIGWHHARQGDADAFLAHWSEYETRTEKTWIDETRRTLIEQISRVRGWRAGLEAAHRPKLSTAGSRSRLLRCALAPLAESVREPELVALFASAPELATVGELERLDLRVRSVIAHAEDRARRNDHPALRPLLDEVIAVDHTVSRAVMQSRDRMLIDLWPAVGSAGTLAEMRRAVRAPVWKRELKELSDDIEPPPA